jgi:hypothetical protein
VNLVERTAPAAFQEARRSGDETRTLLDQLTSVRADYASVVFNAPLGMDSEEVE